MKSLKGLLSVLLPAFSVGFLFISLSDPACAAPKKPKAIPIVLLGDLSGPYATVTMPVKLGFLDACEYINESGGIRGVPIKVVERDSGGRVAVAISHYMEIREMLPKPLGIVGYVSSEGEALRERFGEDTIPAIWTVSMSAIYPACYTFAMSSLYTDLFGLFIDWIVKDWWPQQQWYKERVPRLAFLTWDSPYGRSVLTDECYTYAKERGVEVVATELYGLRDIDASTQLLRIRHKKPDWIYNNTTAHGPAVVTRSMYGFGYRVNFACTPFDHLCYQVGGKLMHGTVGPWGHLSPDEDEHTGVKIVLEFFRKKGRDPKYRTNYYILLWATALTFKEAIQRAVDEVGWGKLDGAAVKTQLERLKDFSPLGLSYYTYSEKRRSPSKARIYRAEGGKILPITDWRECPDLRPAKYK